MLYSKIISELKRQSNPDNVKGMKRFGISVKGTLGVPIPALRQLAKRVGRNHEIAEKLWSSGIHEARILASMVDEPEEVTEKQLDRWANDFYSWDVCDQCCSNLFSRTRYAYEKCTEWSRSDKEFVKRAGYALMAALTVHDRKTEDTEFVKFFPLIKSGAIDERNFVKKAINWALRQIGKRNKRLNKLSIEVAKEISRINSRSAKWIASDALRELTNKKVQSRFS